MYEMRALTLFDPWATFVAHGVKQYETRSFQVSYRGPLAIHSSQRFTKYQKGLCTSRPFASVLTELALKSEWFTGMWIDIPRGCIIAVADLVSIVSTDYIVEHISSTEQALGDYSPGRFAWSLMNVVLLKEPIPVKGSLQLWTPSEEIKSQIHRERLEHDIEIVPPAHI